MSVRACGCYYSNSCSICDIRTYGDLLWEMRFKRLHTGVSRVGSILVSDQAVFPVQTHGYQESSWTDAFDSPQTVPWQNDVPSCHEIDSVHSVTATRISWVTPTTHSRHPGCAAPAVNKGVGGKNWQDTMVYGELSSRIYLTFSFSRHQIGSSERNNCCLIDLNFSLYVLFFQFRPRDVLHGIYHLSFHKLYIHMQVHAHS